MSYALLELTLNLKIDYSWIKDAQPDPLQMLDYAETLMFAASRQDRSLGSNLLNLVLTGASCVHPVCGAVDDPRRVAVFDRSTDIALDVLAAPLGSADRTMIHRFMLQALPVEHSQRLLVRISEDTFAEPKRTGDQLFRQSLKHFVGLSRPLLPPHICAAARDQIRAVEDEYENTLTLCE